MNKKLFYSTTAVTVVVLSGYLYYRHNKVELEKKIMGLEDKAMGLLLDIQDRHRAKDPEIRYLPETDTEEDS